MDDNPFPVKRKDFEKALKDVLIHLKDPLLANYYSHLLKEFVSEKTAHKITNNLNTWKSSGYQSTNLQEQPVAPTKKEFIDALNNLVIYNMAIGNIVRARGYLRMLVLMGDPRSNQLEYNISTIQQKTKQQTRRHQTKF